MTEIEFIFHLIIGIISVLSSVFMVCLINYFNEKEKLKVQKRIVYNELISQKKKILNIKKIINKKYIEIDGNKIPSDLSNINDNGLTNNDNIYNLDFVNKVLGEKFEIYQNYIKNIEEFNKVMESRKTSKQNRLFH